MLLKFETFENPHPSSGVSKCWILLFVGIISCDGLNDFFLAGQQITGFVLLQIALDCWIYCMNAVSLRSSNAVKSFKITGHSLILRQKPCSPFGSRHDSWDNRKSGWCFGRREFELMISGENFVCLTDLYLNGQQTNGFLPPQIVFDRWMYCMSAVSWYSSNVIVSVRTAGHCLIDLQTPSAPFGS